MIADFDIRSLDVPSSPTRNLPHPNGSWNSTSYTDHARESDSLAPEMNGEIGTPNASPNNGGQAASALLPFVYEELRRMAAHKLALEAPGHTLQTTALVHEA